MLRKGKQNTGKAVGVCVEKISILQTASCLSVWGNKLFLKNNMPHGQKFFRVILKLHSCLSGWSPVVRNQDQNIYLLVYMLLCPWMRHLLLSSENLVCPVLILLPNELKDFMGFYHYSDPYKLIKCLLSKLCRFCLPSCSVLVSSTSFFCFSVSTTSARLPLRRSGVPKARLIIGSPRSLEHSSGLGGEVELVR